MRRLLEGRQWQLRQPVQVPPGATVDGSVRDYNGSGPGLVCSRHDGQPIVVLCPLGTSTDWLYCKEPYRVEGRRVVYEADGGEGGRWSSAISMPRSASRLWLRVYDVRLQRLHEARGFDMHGEGVACPLHDTEYTSCFGECPVLRRAFAEQWDRTRGRAAARSGKPWASYAADPMVWALSFTRSDAAAWQRELELHEGELAAARSVAGRSSARGGRRSAAKTRERRR